MRAGDAFTGSFAVSSWPGCLACGYGGWWWRFVVGCGFPAGGV